MANIISTMHTSTWGTKLSPHRIHKSPKINRLFGEVWQQKFIMAGQVSQHLLPKHISQWEDCSATDVCRILEYITELNWKELNYPTDWAPFYFFGTNLSWFLTALSETFGTADEGSMQASAVEESSTWAECQGQN